MPSLALGLDFSDLYQREGLQRIDEAFLAALRGHDASLADRLAAARVAPPAASTDEAALLVDLAPHLDRFIGELFEIVDPLLALRAGHDALAPLIRVKWKFVKRRALLTYPDADALGVFDPDAARVTLTQWLGGPFEELAFAEAVLAWQAAGDAERTDLAARYSAWAVLTEDGQLRHGHEVLFRHPAKVDAMALLRHAQTRDTAGVRITTIDTRQLRRRDGFALTDTGTSRAGALDQAHYCLWCHRQGKDSCAKGLREPPDAAGHAAFKRSLSGTKLTGCPLEERISEFHLVKSQGHAVAALALIAIDNPMVAATGHRICNDCMKACVFQQQTPVDIPQAETRTLKDVLSLPWGFEIYSLLTRWNPLNLRRPLPAPASGRKVLVVGMGPAGFTLAHHLLNDGHGVVGIDGLKIEPLPSSLSSVATDGSRTAFEPIEDITTLWEPLDERVMAGFGGVAEYGITVRWDKNFLKLIRLLLERRSRFSLIGGVRFGGTLGVDDAFALGFDHIALAMGAGRPTTLDIPNGLARGVRTASDFLMALQLTGAARADSLANMQVRLPVVVIGGGLTAIDTATESLAYYLVQVEKFLARQEALVTRLGEPAVRAGWSPEDCAIADEFIAHARAIRTERARAADHNEAPRLLELLQAWGGATVAYRKRLVDSPAYTLNHEEVEHALAEGIRFAECVAPVQIEVDAYGAASAITLARQVRDDAGNWRAADTVSLPARAIFIAAGTRPNTVLAREDPTHFSLEGHYFRAIDEAGRPVRPEHAISKPETAQVLLGRAPDGRMLSFFGDLHPSYFGNVVKAMGSARQGYPVVSRLLAARKPASGQPFGAFAAHLNALLRATVVRVERLAPTIVEVVVHAPLAARQFKPGQFYRLQNFEMLADQVSVAGQPTRLAMEGLALTGAWVDHERGLVSTIVLEMGGSSNLCARLQPGEPVVLMGPTGAPTDIAGNETVVLVGGGLGNAVLFSIGAAFRAAGSTVLYFAGYKQAIDRYRIADIEAAADVVVWCCDAAPGFVPGRPQDRSFVGNVVDAMLAWARGDLGPGGPALSDAQRLLAIGSDRMMAAVAGARHRMLAPYLKPGHLALGSINSPMQCMMKEVCAQCLQARRDPVSGAVRYVFSCFNQDQPLDEVDFPMLDQRLRQNALQEHLTRHWVAQCLAPTTARHTGDTA